MQYPLISEYVRAIQDASSNLDKLAHLVPVQDDHGEPYRSSGAFAVVFKMKDEQTGKCYALKCFTEEQEGRAEAYRQIADELEFVDSSYITSVKYLDKEIFVDSSCEEDEFPVLLMDWIDGETMETYIANNYQNEYAMGMLCYRFCKMAAWLRSQLFAHGDIKPDNIIVRPDGTLTLVDYDGMFVPAMKGQKSPTIGTKDFSHPLRTIDDFDETIDDFALASIALSLKAISLKPSLLDEYGAADRLLFSAEDYRDLSKSKVLAALQELMNDKEVNTLLSMFLLANAKKNLAMHSFRLFVGKKPESKIEILSTEVLDEELENAIMDEYGVKYSKDGQKLLKAPKEFYGSYTIKQGTKVVCDNAFCGCYHLTDIKIPKSIKAIGFMSFRDCVSIRLLGLPASLINIGLAAFVGCENLMMIEIPSNVQYMENPFVGLKCPIFIKSQYFSYKNGILLNKEETCIIAYLSSKEHYVLPSKIIKISNGAFWRCEQLKSIQMNDVVKEIGNWAFCACTHLRSLMIPKSVAKIGHSAFMLCRDLYEISILNNNAKIGRSAFLYCYSLSEGKTDLLKKQFGEQTFASPLIISKHNS